LKLFKSENALFQRKRRNNREERKGREKLISTKNFFIVFFCLIILSGCAKKNAIRQVSEEEALRTRIEEFWNFRKKLELDKCYYYEYPLLRKKISLVQYIKSFNTELIQWKEFDIRDITIFDRNTAEVKLNIIVLVKMPMVKRFEDETEVTEKWINVDGTWYHVSEKF
jgi:hypothetical protein